jgi:hypothetical protein
VNFGTYIKAHGTSLNTIIESGNLVLKLVNSFWLETSTMVSEGEEKSTTTSDSEIEEDKSKGYGTTRHGSHLTKTSEGVAESEDVEGKKA